MDSGLLRAVWMAGALSLAAHSGSAQSFPSALHDLGADAYPSYTTKRCAVLLDLAAEPSFGDLLGLSRGQQDQIDARVDGVRSFSSLIWDLGNGFDSVFKGQYRDPLALSRLSTPIAQTYSTMINTNFLNYGNPRHGIVGRDLETCLAMIGLTDN